MSAFSVGAQVATKTKVVAGDKNKREANIDNKSVPGTFVKWIPGEAITFYTALLGVGAAQGVVKGDETAQQLLERIDAGSRGWFLVAAIVATAFVIAGALAESGKRRPVSPFSLIVRCLLTLGSFAIWASAMPGSWPYGWHLIRDLGPAYGLLLVPLASLFAFVSEKLTAKYRL